MNFLQLALVLALSYACLAQEGELGLPQICRCYPPGTIGAPAPPFTPKQPATCQKRVQIDISFVADDGVILYICGRNVRQSSNFDELQSFTFNDLCDDFMLKVNNKGLSAGVALLATFNGQKYGTTSSDTKFRVPGTKPLFAIAKFQPGGDWTSNPPNYDFSSWTPAVVVESILGHGPNFDMLARQGAFPINVANGDVSPGTYGLKLSVPFCS